MNTPSYLVLCFLVIHCLPVYLCNAISFSGSVLWTTVKKKKRERKILTDWAQLFKANDVVSQRFVKIYIKWYANMLKFFAEKMWVAFAVQKLLTFFSAKNIRLLYLESAKTVNEMTLNELVKLTTLWTTGPWLTDMLSLTIFSRFIHLFFLFYAQFFFFRKFPIYFM